VVLYSQIKLYIILPQTAVKPRAVAVKISFAILSSPGAAGLYHLSSSQLHGDEQQELFSVLYQDESDLRPRVYQK
jgi:hypothetical protein